MKILITILTLLISSTVFAQQQQPDIVTISRTSLEASMQAHSDLRTAFESGALLIKELRTENKEQRDLIQMQVRQIKTLELANTKLEQANQALLEALEVQKRTLAIVGERAAKEIATLNGKIKSSRRRKVFIAGVKIAAIGGAIVVCGPYCGVAAAIGLESIPILQK